MGGRSAKPGTRTRRRSLGPGQGREDEEKSKRYLWSARQKQRPTATGREYVGGQARMKAGRGLDGGIGGGGVQRANGVGHS